jgi:hypothetical protein
VKTIIKAKAVMMNGRALQLPASKGGKGHYQPILASIVGQLDAMHSYHCKLLVIRLDVHLYDGTHDNKVLSDLMRRYRKWTTRKGYERLGYVWCREQETGKAQHYHLALILDASKTRHPHHHIEQIEHLWHTRELGSVYTPTNCYTVLKRGDKLAFQKLFNRLSYLGKVASKASRPMLTNDYSSSRFKPKKCDQLRA